MTKRILILGSTGSIGTQALEVIAANPDRFQVVGIAAGGQQPELLITQAKALGLRAEHVAVANAEAADVVSEALGGTVLRDAVELVQSVAADTVLNALVGSMGLRATMAALESGATLALANKESLVAGGQLVMQAVGPGQLVPVDSEHSAMAQCLMAGQRAEVAHMVLTASGGPFRGWTREQMWDVTPEQAAAHPTWSMGQMNTLNSATLVNKGLEFIEATLLFGLAAKDIEVVVHPQSIVHSMVTFCDGATIAQASPPSMKMPIALSLDWPTRVPGAQHCLDFREAMQWDFYPVDNHAFPAVQLAAQAADASGTFPAVYNAANEQAAAAFLAGKLHFPQIVDTVAAVLDQASQFAGVVSNIDEVLEHELRARQLADRYIQQHQ